MRSAWSTQHTFPSGEELASCTVCHCAEGTLPTHCPGARVSAEDQDAIYAGRLEFSGGQWWVPRG